MTPTQRLPLRHNEERAEVQCVSSPPCSLFARRDCNRHRGATEAMEAMGWLPKLQFLNDFDVLEIAYKALTAANKSPDIFDWMGHSSLFMWLFNAQVPCRRVLLRSFHCEVVWSVRSLMLVNHSTAEWFEWDFAGSTKMVIQHERSWPSAPARLTFERLVKAYGIPWLWTAGSCRSLLQRYKQHATGNGNGNGQFLIEDCQNCQLWSFHRMLRAYMASLLQLHFGSFFCIPFTVAEAAKVAPCFWRSAPLVLFQSFLVQK